MNKRYSTLLIRESIKKVKHADVDYIHCPFEENFLLFDRWMQKVSCEGEHKLWVELFLSDFLYLEVEVINLEWDVRSLERELGIAALYASILEHLGPILYIKENILLHSLHLLLFLRLQHLFHCKLGVIVLLVHM